MPKPYSKHPALARLQAIQRHTEWVGDCLQSTCATDKDGYGRLGVAGKTHRVPRLAWEVLVGPIPPGRLVLHNCHNRKCCNPKHLRLGTQSENIQDTVDIRSHHNLKRTAELVLRARIKRYVGQQSFRSIGRDLGVDHKTVWRWINESE